MYTPKIFCHMLKKKDTQQHKRRLTENYLFALELSVTKKKRKKRRVTQTGLEPAPLLLRGNALNNQLQCHVAGDDKMLTHQNINVG